MLKFNELNVFVTLKKDIHFQYAPELISKMLKKAGNIQEEKFVFSNLGKANSNGFFSKKGNFKLRSLDDVLIEDFIKGLQNYEDENFKINYIVQTISSFKKIKSIYTLNPVFLKMENGLFWTFKSSGDIKKFINLIEKDLIDKFELYFEEKLELKNSFIKFINFKNEKPFTYIKDGKKCFGYKTYFELKEDDISQLLGFIAIANGIGHLNEEVGGGFSNILK